MDKNTYKIKLGVELDTNSIKKELSNVTGTTHRVRIDIDNSRFLKQVQHIKKELRGLNNGNNQPSLSFNKSASNNAAKQVGKEIGNTIDKSLQQSLNIDDVINQQVSKLMKEYGVKGKKAFDEIRQAVISYRNELKSLNDDTPFDISDMDVSKFANIKQVTNAIASNMKVVNEEAKVYKSLLEYVQRVNKSGAKIHLPDSIKQEYGKEFSSMRKQLGNAFTGTGQGTDFEVFIRQLNGELGNVIDLSKGAEHAFSDLLDKLKIAKSEKFISGDKLFNIGELRLEEVEKDVISAVNNIDEAENKLAQASTETTDIISRNEERKRQEIERTADTYRRTNQQTKRLISDEAQESIENVSSSRYYKLNKSDSDAFHNEMNNLVNQWTNNKGKLVDLKISTKSYYDEEQGANVERLHQAQVRYNNELGETITKTIAWRQIGSQTINGKEVAIRGFAEVAGQYSKTIDKAKAKTDKFAQQQKQTAANLTNTINQLHSDAMDKNANRPIKEEGNINKLKGKYNEITSAIQRMGSASGDAFLDAKLEVDKLISEYKILVKEFKNAENVASKMKGTDFESGLEIAKHDLNKLKANAKDFPQMIDTIDKLNDAIKGVGNASSLNEFNDQLRVARAELAKVKAETIAANRKEKVGIDVSGVTSSIANIQRISPEINEFKTEIDGAEVSVESLLNDLSKVKTAGDFSVINKKFNSFKKAAESAGITVTETVAKAKTIGDIKFKLSDTGFNGFRQEVARAHMEAEKLEGVYNDLEASLKQLDIAMEGVYSAEKTGDVKQLVAANEAYENALKAVYSQLKLNQQAEKEDYNNKILTQKKATLSSEMEIWLKENSRAANDFGDEIRRLQSSLDGLDDKGVRLVGQQFNNIKKQAEAAGKTGLTVFDKLKSKAKEYMAYLSAVELFMYAEQALRSMFEQVKAIDSAMTELKKVTDETNASYDKFLTNAASRAKEIGTTIDGLVNSTADFVRLGYGFEDAQGLAEVANIYAVVGDEVEGVEGATESLISTMAAYKNEMNGLSNTDFAMGIIDKYNEIGNKFSITSGGIGEALERSASSLNAANNSMDESIALITAANTVVVLCHAT